MKRIDQKTEILSALAEIWAQFPNYTFGQLIVYTGLAKDDLTTFHRLDSETIAMLKKYRTIQKSVLRCCK
jgi:hypothetical protein